MTKGFQGGSLLEERSSSILQTEVPTLGLPPDSLYVLGPAAFNLSE